MTALLEPRPKIKTGSHPVETTNYIHVTPAVEAMCEQALRWIRNRMTGGMFMGKPRMGKTKGILHVSAIIAQNYPGIPVERFVCPRYKQAFARPFYHDLLRAIHHQVITSGDNGAKLERICRLLVSRARTAGDDRVILWIDEAQRLLDLHYDWLSDIHNALQEQGIHFIVFLVGQPELIHKRATFLLEEKDQIVGRFMSHTALFAGITSGDELAECLKCYDEHSEFPAGSGWSFTRWYYPKAFAHGWRLQQISQELWTEFVETGKRRQMRGPYELPMSYFCRTVEYILKAGEKLDVAKLALPDELIVEAIRESGYADVVDSES